MQHRSFTAISRSLLVLAVCAISYLATTSLSMPVVEDLNDKASHVLAFFVLALLVDFSWPRTRFGMRKAAGLLGYGMLIECVQYFLPYRSFSLLDWAADGLGLVLYRALVPLLAGIYPFSLRWRA